MNIKTRIQACLFIIGLFTLSSCKQKKEPQTTSEAATQVIQKVPAEQPQDTTVKKEKKTIPKHYEHKYVAARSGLNYRDSPNGKVLGKFALNTSLTILEHTHITDTLHNEGKFMVGEWVGVQEDWHSGKDTATVYVFNSFLSGTWVQSDIKLYEALPFDETSGRIRTAFLNLSETYFEDAYDGKGDRARNSIFTESDLEKDTIRLNKNQRKKFLKFSNIQESEQVFVYFMARDEIKTYKVKGLPVIAFINPYGASRDYQREEFDYMLGFDLGRSITNWEDNLAYVGKENPFRTGQLQPILWKEIPNNQYPLPREAGEKKIKLISYQFSTEQYDYFLQKTAEWGGSYHLVVIDKQTKAEVLNENYSEGESTYLTGLNIVGNDQERNQQSQWTGKLLKNKASLVFGFLGYSFGCPSITVLDETEPQIHIRCDNRH